MNVFQYWPRFVARILRIKAIYRGNFADWKIEAQFNDFPIQRDFEQCEKRNYPEWECSENYPWNIANRLSTFPYPDMVWTFKYPNGKKYKSKLKIFDPNDAKIFKGDRVKVLIGPDKGKNGIVIGIIKMRNLVIVEGLNTFHHFGKNKTVLVREMPLNIKTEVSLIDPQDGNECEVDWRYDESGARVRVSTRTGRIIPMPTGAQALDDGTIPSLATIGDKDTTETDLVTVTYKPVLRTFTDDVLLQAGITETRKRAPTFWY